MLIFELVSPVLVGFFLVITLVAVLLHRASGTAQKIPMTFLGLVCLALWLGNEPYGEPVPGATKTIVIIATCLQTFIACAAYACWGHKRKQVK
ncbi:hypothetical protein [Pseudomonas sp. NPDC096950]|uniref:hypothetical protein n=1 Tax=Pseudomonas sp. NPDC096950 TaxID=3364485 RepID=UPI00383BF67C